MAQFITLVAGLLLLQLLCLQPPAVLAFDVIVIGDSTASDYSNSPSTYPQAGWAMFLQDHLSSGATVQNLAVPGSSSKSYYDQQLWQVVKSRYLSAGDYVLVQFGHNDQNSGASNLYTSPYTTYKEYLSIYIDETNAANAHPILVTPISRAVWNNGVFEQTLGDYPAAMRQLAEDRNVPLIDLNAETEALFTSLGESTTQNKLFMCLPAGAYSNYPQGDFDTTHLQVEGAKEVAALAAQDLNAYLAG